MKNIWSDGLKKHSTLKRKGQVIVKGQENPLTRRRQNREKLKLNEKYKSVVVFEPDLKLKRPPGNAINECWNSPFGRLKIEFKNFSKLQPKTNHQMPDAWCLMPDAA